MRLIENQFKPMRADGLNTLIMAGLKNLRNLPVLGGKYPCTGTSQESYIAKEEPKTVRLEFS